MDFTREGRAVTYIHYGASAFDPEKFKPAVQNGCWHKPKGGLWASPIGAGHSWKDWFGKYVIVGDRDAFWSYQGFNVGFDKFDVYKMIADGYDGLEISLTSFWPLYDYLYGWDCDSIVIFRKEVVVV